MSERVVIVGGGLAGLAAAAALAEQGVSVSLYESRPRLGGRASSFFDQTTESLIDNCQHVNLGCCTNFQHFCRMLGLDEYFRTETALYFVSPTNEIHKFQAGPWPAPLHLLGAFRRLSYLSKSDRRSLVKGLKALAKLNPQEREQQTFADWLAEQQQPATVIERFWHVVLVSALSETLDRIAVPHARKVFVDAFLANRTGWQVQIPMVPLAELYGERLLNWFAEREVALHQQTGVSQVLLEDHQATGIQLRDGEHLLAEHVILAVPFHLVPSLLPAEQQNDSAVQSISQLETAPISSVHLWFDRAITELPHATFVERLSQWMFNRSQLQPNLQHTAPDRHAYQIVISASRELRKQSQEETILHVVQELTDVWPETARAKLLHSRLVTEHKAVFSVLPGSDALRPPQQSPIPNLQYAGDWTQTGWPATMEGAVRSGFLAAENVLRHLGQSVKIVQPDLPIAKLSRLAFKLRH